MVSPRRWYQGRRAIAALPPAPTLLHVLGTIAPCLSLIWNMKTLDLYLFLSSFTLCVAMVAVAEMLRKRDGSRFLTAVVALLAIPCNAYVGSHLDPERSVLGIFQYLSQERDTSAIVAVTMGIAAAVAWYVRLFRTSNEPALSGRLRWTESILLALSVAAVVMCGQAYLWKEVLGFTRYAFTVQPPFLIEKIADLDEEPLRMAIDERGDIFICYDYFKKHGAWGGAILRFRENPDTGAFEPRIVVESPFLARCYGLAVHNGDIYVSRSGFLPRTNLGQVTYAHSGAITQLKDLDGDGYYEYAHDVITDLPGVRAPDTMQQNNGIVFASDGSLFVTNASAADRTLDEHPWGGTILRFPPDFSAPEIYARGFRNPWEIDLGPDDEVFVTDSDVDKNPGDEINHVQSGAHYGHPFVIPNEPGVHPEGFVDPVFVGERESVFLGMTYATSARLPEKFRNCIYVADFRQDRILRVVLGRAGETYKAEDVQPFAFVPSPIDIVATGDGEFFVISRRAKQLYRIRTKN